MWYRTNSTKSVWVAAGGGEGINHSNTDGSKNPKPAKIQGRRLHSLRWFFNVKGTLGLGTLFQLFREDDPLLLKNVSI